jgi:hypothetical protein
MVTLTPPELQALREEGGEAAVKRHFENEKRHVFGHDYKVDKHGKPIEQGIGSPGNESENHYRALEKYEGAAAAAKARAAAKAAR